MKMPFIKSKEQNGKVIT